MSKRIDFDKTVYELCSEDPEIAGILAEAGFSEIMSPAMRQTAGRFMTVPKGARMKGLSMDEIRRVFQGYGYEV